MLISHHIVSRRDDFVIVIMIDRFDHEQEHE